MTPWPARPVAIIAPDGAPRPVVGHLPHASRTIPDEVRSAFLLDDVELQRELLRLTDAHTDALFAWLGRRGATRVVNRISRLVLDPERFLDDGLEPAASRGHGVVYTHGSDGQRLRHLTPAARADLVERLYRPYHAAFEALVSDLLETSGGCTIIDCHSFPSVPLPSDLDQAPTDRPDICLGTHPLHTPPELVDALEAAFAVQGLVVRRDTPYAGTFVPSSRFETDARVRSVMIEVRRGLYMDEASGRRTGSFGAVARTLERAVVEAGILG